MLSTIGILSILLALCCSLSLAAGQFSRPTADLSLMRFMAQTRDAQGNDPDRTIACFDQFVPIFAENLETYESEYKECIATADSDRLGVDRSFQPQLDWIEDTSVDVCSALYECSKINETRGALQCYNAAGSNHSMALYNIAANASETDAAIAQKYELIKFDQNRCTNASEDRYVQKTAETYNAMHLCFLGRSLEPQPDPSTTVGADGVFNGSTEDPPAVAAAEEETESEGAASDAEAMARLSAIGNGESEDKKTPAETMGKNILSFLNNMKRQLRH